MRAYVCDACGNTYRPYVAKTEEGELGVAANGMTFVKIDRDGSLANRGKLELCPNCMEKVFSFVFDDLCDENSPFIEKVKFYMEKNKKVKDAPIPSHASEEDGE